MSHAARRIAITLAALAAAAAAAAGATATAADHTPRPAADHVYCC
jgi:hypothetical protein